MLQFRTNHVARVILCKYLTDEYCEEFFLHPREFQTIEHVSLHLRDILNKRSRISKDINNKQTVFAESKIQEGYGKANKTSKFGKFQYIVYIYVCFAQPNVINFYFLSLRIFFISSVHI